MATKPEEKVKVQLARLGGSKDPFEVDLYWTVNDLLTTVSTKFEIPKESLKLLCKGKMLNDKIGSKTLKSLKIKKNDKIILMNKPQLKKPKPSKSSMVENTTNNDNNKSGNNNSNNSVDDAIKRKKNIEEIKAAAEKLAARDNDGYDWNANYYLELSNQYGDKIHLPDDQRQALTVGLTLHEKGKKFMKSGNYKDAVYIMNLAFESFSKVNSEFLEAVDNYGLLALDIVWCYYLDQDESNLINAGKWLQIAEYGLQRAHGKNMERLKQIRSQQNMAAVTGDFIPELSLYVRLNILRALQSFYNNDINTAQTHLMRAEMDMRKLQISDIDLVKLESMGFTHRESRRALRFCSGNIDSAINHIYNKRDEQERARKAEQKRLEQRALQRKYGLTKNGKFVDLKLLDQLQGMGVEKEIAIESLRQTDNAGDDTLNLCLDPQRKEVLAQTLFSRYFNDKYLYKIEQILSILGSDNVTESRVRAALFLTFNDVEESVNILSAPNPTQVIDLDRIELRFVPFVQQRQERILREKLMAEKMRKLREEQEEEEEQKKKEMELNNDNNDNNDNNNDDGGDDVMMNNDDNNNNNNDNLDVHIDGNTDNDDNDEEEANNNNNKQEMVIDDDDDIKKDENGNVVDPLNIKVKAMPNPHLGDKNEDSDNDEDDIMNNLVSQYKPIQHTLPNDDDMQIEQHLLDDFDNDDDAYLDIDLSKEQDALTNLKVLLNSMDNQTVNDQQSFLSLFKK